MWLQKGYQQMFFWARFKKPLYSIYAKLLASKILRWRHKVSCYIPFPPPYNSPSALEPVKGCKGAPPKILT